MFAGLRIIHMSSTRRYNPRKEALCSLVKIPIVSALEFLFSGFDQFYNEDPIR